MSEFETWWYHEGSAFRPVDEDIEEFSKRMCQLAWKKSQEAEREVCARVADKISDKYGWGYSGNEVDTADEIAAAIRAWGERLAQPQAMQLRPSEFVQLVMGQETLTGFPVYWAEWPSKEQP